MTNQDPQKILTASILAITRLWHYYHSNKNIIKLEDWKADSYG